MRHFACAVILSLCGIYRVSAQELKSPSNAEMQAAADHGDATAQYQLARAYLRGEGVPKDPKRAFDLMKAAADQGNPDAIGGLGYFYSVGLVVPRDKNVAIEWFRKGAEKGSAKAQLNLGNLLLNLGDTADKTISNRKEGVDWIQRAADQNLPEAALAYGSILYFGDHGVEKNYDLSAKYSKFAAEAGFPDAQNLLGNLYDYGWGVPADVAMAKHWFRKAAFQGNTKAQSNLGRLMGLTSDVNDVRIEAIAWLLIASDQGEVTAQKELKDHLVGLKDGDMNAASTLAAQLQVQIHKRSN